VKYYTDTEYGITYRYGLLRGKRHLVFNNIVDFENYMGACGMVPSLNYDWRHAEVGEWVLADDGCVLEILRNDKGFVRTIVGTYVARLMDMHTDFTLRENRYVLGSRGTTNRFKNVSGRDKMTRGELLFAIFLLTGRDAEEAYCLAFRYRGKYAKRYAMLLLKQERIRKYMNEKSIEAASRCGVNEDWIITAFKNVVDAEGVKTRDKLVALKQLGVYIGMEDKETGEKEPFSGLLVESRERRFLEQFDSGESGALPVDGLPDDIKSLNELGESAE